MNLHYLIYFSSFVPHFEQKMEPSGFAAPHSGQNAKFWLGTAFPVVELLKLGSIFVSEVIADLNISISSL